MPTPLLRFAFKGYHQRSHKLAWTSEKQVGHNPAQALCSAWPVRGRSREPTSFPLCPNSHHNTWPATIYFHEHHAHSPSATRSWFCLKLLSVQKKHPIFNWLSRVWDCTSNRSVYDNVRATFLKYICFLLILNTMAHPNIEFQVQLWSQDYLVTLLHRTTYGLQNSVLPRHVHKPAFPRKQLFLVTKTQKKGEGQNYSGSNLMNICIPDPSASWFSVFAIWGRHCHLVPFS